MHKRLDSASAFAACDASLHCCQVPIYRDVMTVLDPIIHAHEKDHHADYQWLLKLVLLFLIPDADVDEVYENMPVRKEQKE